MMMAMLAVIIPFATASSTNAQTRYYRNGRTAYATTYKRPSIYRRHRNLINIGIGTGAGALLGGLLGGKKGALLGAAAGGAGSAIYTYKIRPKVRRY